MVRYFINATGMKTQQLTSRAFRLSVEEEGKEIARAYLYIIRNDLHEAPYGLMEDVFVDPESRGSGAGTKMVKALVEKARETGCYKIIGTSRVDRPRVHELYTRLGFREYGKEFRMELGK